MPTPREVEVACENYWKDLGYDTRRAIVTKWQKVDLFGADVIAKNKNQTVYIQVTKSKPEGISSRRMKLENQKWCPTDGVLIFQFIEEREGRRKTYFFRIQEMYKNRLWFIWDFFIPVPREWFKVKKEDSLEKNNPRRI